MGNTITHKAICAACEGELLGETREQGNHERIGWRHAYQSDELKGGLHLAYPQAESVVEV